MRQIFRITGAVVVLAYVVLVCLDVGTNWIHPRAYLFLVPLASLGLVAWLGKKELVSLLMLFLGVSVWLWTEEILEHYSGVQIDRFTTLRGRLSALVISMLIFVFFRYLLLESVIRFFRNLWRVLSIRGVLSAIISFCVIYVSFLYFFGLVYASVYASAGNEVFHVPREVSLSDFMYFSVVTATTLGYGDIYPTAQVTTVLVTLQVIFSILMVSIYLGVVVGRITQAQEQNGQQPVRGDAEDRVPHP